MLDAGPPRPPASPSPPPAAPPAPDCAVTTAASQLLYLAGKSCRFAPLSDRRSAPAAPAAPPRPPAPTIYGRKGGPAEDEPKWVPPEVDEAETTRCCPPRHRQTCRILVS